MTYFIENEFLKVGVKSFGAELTSVESKKSGFQFLWQGNPDIWHGQSPVLFPIIGRLLNDTYYVNGKEYSMPKHGLFRKREAELKEKTDTKLIFIQKEDEETLEKYPYKFLVRVIFELFDSSLKVTHEVINTNDGKMYFSLGAHPAFNCKIGDYLEFDENETLDTVSIDNESIRLSEKTPVLNNESKIVITKDIFNNDALILSGIKSKNITLKSPDHNRTVKFNMGGCPYLGIWAKPGAPYVCIEPWWGVNDSYDKKSDFSQKDAIEALDAKEKFTCFWAAEFSE